LELVFSKDSTGTGETETIGFYIHFEDRSCSLVFPAKVHVDNANAGININLAVIYTIQAENTNQLAVMLRVIQYPVDSQV